MKIGWITFSPKLSTASVRLRAYWPMKFLNEMGIEAESYETHKHYDVVVFLKAYSAQHIELATKLAAQGTKLCFDLCDNHFFRTDNPSEDATRHNRLRQMIGRADIVTTCSETLKEIIQREAGERGSNVFIIEDMVEPSTIPEIEAPSWFWRTWNTVCVQRALQMGISARKPGRVRIVWFGNAFGATREMGLKDVNRVVPALRHLSNRYPVQLTIISNSFGYYVRQRLSWRFPANYFAWDGTMFGQLLRSFDIAVLPISENEVTVCKSANRLVTALNAGLAVVADFIPSYRPFRECVAFGDWDRSIERYIESDNLRVAHAQIARGILSSRYSYDVIGAQWLAILKGL